MKSFQEGFWRTLFRPRCPACGDGYLFQKFVGFLPQCPSCSFEYTQWVKDDGPAFFVLSILCAVVVPLAIWVEVAFEPALWVHIVAWTALIFIGTVLMLRPVKAVWIYCQWYFRASKKDT